MENSVWIMGVFCCIIIAKMAQNGKKALYTHILLIRPQNNFRNVLSHFTDARHSKIAESKLEHKLLASP